MRLTLWIVALVLWALLARWVITYRSIEPIATIDPALERLTSYHDGKVDK